MTHPPFGDAADSENDPAAWGAAAAQTALSKAMRPWPEDRLAPSPVGEGPLSPLPLIRGYRIERRVGQGRMSTAYLAEDLECGGQVVLKILQRRHSAAQAGCGPFLSEFSIPAAIRHPHVIRVFDYEFGDNLAYIAMEYLDGGDLRKLVRRGLSAAEAVVLVRQAASALEEVHRSGAVHRDVKPENLLLRACGALVLADFGSAWRRDHPGTVPQPGQLVGTPRYVSPEQAQGAAVSAAADVYSLGVVFYEMLCGRTPFPGTTLMEVLSQHLMAPVPRLPDPLRRYQPLLDAMLDKSVVRRLPDGGAVLAQIDRLEAPGSFVVPESGNYN